MRRYVFADQKIFAVKNAGEADAQKLGEAIEKIASHNNGEVEPSMLWREARGNPRHPAHQLFEWNVERAAEAHWTDTARRIIRAIVPLDEEGEEMEIPAFISINTGGGVHYKSSQEIMESKDLRDIVLAQAEKDMVAFQLRYRRFKELFEALETPIKVVRKMRGKPKTEDRPHV